MSYPSPGSWEMLCFQIKVTGAASTQSASTWPCTLVKLMIWNWRKKKKLLLYFFPLQEIPTLLGVWLRLVPQSATFPHTSRREDNWKQVLIPYLTLLLSGFDASVSWSGNHFSQVHKMKTDAFLKTCSFLLQDHSECSNYSPWSFHHMYSLYWFILRDLEVTIHSWDFLSSNPLTNHVNCNKSWWIFALTDFLCVDVDQKRACNKNRPILAWLALTGDSAVCQRTADEN